MSDKIEQIKDRLRKALELARRGSTDGERDNAMSMVQRLLIKHQLEMADLGLPRDETVHASVVGRNGPWARGVAASISKLNFCSYFFNRIGTSTDQRLVKHTFVGKPIEVETAKELSLIIIEQLWTESGRLARLNGDPSFQRSFLNGASSAIYHRVMELITRAKESNVETSQSMALLFVTAYQVAETENKQYLDTTFKIKSEKTRARSNSREGASAGQTFGRSIPLHLSKKIS